MKFEYNWVKLVKKMHSLQFPRIFNSREKMDILKSFKFSTEKLEKSQLFTKGMLVLGNDLLYQNGVSLFKSGDKKRKWFYNPFLCLTLLSIIFFRDLSSLLVDSETYSTIVGDFALKIKFKKQFNIVLSSAEGMMVLSHLCHIWYGYHNKESYLIDLDLKQSRHLLESVNSKWKPMINLFLLVNRIFVALMLSISSFGSLYINLSFKDFLIFGVFWSLMSTLCAFISYMGIWYIQLFYFFFVSKYFTNQFKLINHRIVYLTLIRTKRNFNLCLKTLLRELDATHRALENSDKFWSKYLLFNWMSLSLGITTEIIFLSFERDLGLIYGMWFIDCIAFIFYFMFLIKSAVSVHNEANKTYRCLYSLLNENYSNLYLSNNFKVSLI